jgi:hypothetical protein
MSKLWPTVHHCGFADTPRHPPRPMAPEAHGAPRHRRHAPSYENNTRRTRDSRQ